MRCNIQLKNKLFLSALSVLVLFCSVYTMIREPRKISPLENRLLAQFPDFQFQHFMSGEFQEKWEDALGDQFVGNTTLKRWYNRYKLSSLRALFETMRPFLPDMRTRDGSNDETYDQESIRFEASYIPKGENIFQIEPGGNLVFFDYRKEYLETLIQKMEEMVSDLGHIQSPLFPKYYMYYIEESRDIDFPNHEITHLFANTAKDIFRTIGEFDSFTFRSLDEYQTKMYRSDHHWNHIGQIEGYRNIIRLLLGNDEPILTITPQHIPNIRFTGSFGRTVADFSVGDDFYIGEVRLAPHRVIIGGVDESIAKKYGKNQEYLRGEFDPNPEINHYGECFGQDTGLIVFDFHTPQKENLLMIADSFSNPINAWIASHFNRTYIVDLRHYEDYVGTPFSVSEFAFMNEINKILIVGSGAMIRNTIFQLEPSKK